MHQCGVETSVAASECFTVLNIHSTDDEDEDVLLLMSDHDPGVVEAQSHETQPYYPDHRSAAWGSLPKQNHLADCLVLGLETTRKEDSSGFGPVLEEEPMDMVYPEESSEEKITLTCRSRASPPPQYRWLLNDTELLISEGDSHFSLSEGNLIISHPERHLHTGNYTCVSSNVYGSVVSHRASVQFGYLDMFSTDDREAVYVKEGQGAVLLCAPPPHYPEDLSFRWMLNDFPVFITQDSRRFVSQGNGNLYIANVQRGDRGNYSCFISSGSIPKNVFSKFIPLEPISERSVRKYPADIKVKTPNITALVGQNITLECFALGNPVPDLRWRRVDGSGSDLHASGSGSLLRLQQLQYKDQGVYECEAHNSKGKDRHQTHLTVEGAPEWLQTINSAEIGVGGEFAMSCLAGGKPKPQVHFLKNGLMQLLKGEEINFPALTVDDSGMYQCVAENIHGMITANAELRVFTSAPSFVRTPVKPRLLGAKNNRVVIPCKPRAAPPAKISWSRGTELLHNSSRIFIWGDGSLELLNLSQADEGKYTCFAENHLGRANSTGSLTITDATIITLAPSNADVSVGEGVRMECGASYDPILDLTFIWSLDDHEINLENEREREHYQIKMDLNGSGASGSELLISNTQLHHAGRYTCTAQTPVDQTTSSAMLLVRGPPGPPGGVRVDEVKPDSCKVRWSPGSDNLSPISKYSIQFREAEAMPDWRDASTSPATVEGNSEMATVLNLTPWTEYEFRVFATNTLGTGPPSEPSPRVFSTEARPIVAPSDVGGGGGTSRELTITWTPVERRYFFGSGFGYIIAFRPEDESEWRRVTVTDPEARRYVHKDQRMAPASRFEVKVKAFNSQGEGPFSQSAFIYSALDVPAEAPVLTEVRALSATEVIVVWIPLQQSTLEGYQVRYWRDSLDGEASALRVLVSGRENHTRLDHLRPDSQYLVEVRAYNAAGFGPAGPRSRITTKRAPPSRPPKIIGTKMHYSGGSINVAWERVEALANESSVAGYKVLYRPEGQPSGNLYTTEKHSIDLPLMKGLYLVEVRAHSEGGDGAVAQVRITGSSSLASPTLGFFSTVFLGLLLRFLL
ncbi:hypothetical protein DNTS_023886 [Danionella cerebrum]|uniref:Contactin-1 n=1 Tax=Danionella cerebrum TaxID=2873325 RepID=A0A553MUV0_9TELE|nr:hypothetical protein DNTS_023886 [Danionella translucida]